MDQSKGPTVGRLKKILKAVNSYVRMAIQYNPAITALVWAGVRTIL